MSTTQRITSDVTEASGESHGWARPWLESVAASARAIARERHAQELRRARADSIASQRVGSIHGKGGGPDAHAASDAYVDAEAALRGGPGTYLSDHFERLVEFDRAMESLRCGTRDEINEATYAAEYRFVMGHSERRAAEELGVSQTTLRTRICSLIDYLNLIGPASVGVRP